MAANKGEGRKNDEMNDDAREATGAIEVDGQATNEQPTIEQREPEGEEATLVLTEPQGPETTVELTEPESEQPTLVLTEPDHREGATALPGSPAWQASETLPGSGPSTAATVPLAPAEPWLTPAGATAPTAGPASGGWAVTASTGRPPVRWGGVVWGILLVLFAGGTLFVLSAPSRLATAELWLASLTPGATWALWVALLGLLIVVFALLGAIRSAQRRRPQPRS